MTQTAFHFEAIFWTDTGCDRTVLAKRIQSDPSCRLDPAEILRGLDRMVADGLLAQTGSWLKVTDSGWDLWVTRNDT